MTTVRLLPKAECDIMEAVEWYDAEREGLGVQFEEYVTSTLDRIRENPSLFPVHHQGARRALVDTFPYGVLFVESAGEVLVVAFLHLHRDPNIWKSRQR